MMSYYQYTLWGEHGSVYGTLVLPKTLSSEWSVCYVCAPNPLKRRWPVMLIGLIGLILTACGSHPFDGEDHIYDGPTSKEQTDARVTELVVADPQLAATADEAAQWWTDAVGADLHRVKECTGAFPCVKVEWADLPHSPNDWVGAQTTTHEVKVSSLMQGDHPTFSWMPDKGLLVIVAHEFGHVLKLGHASGAEELMAENYSGGAHVCIGQETLNLFTAKYGTTGNVVCKDIP